MALKVQHCQRGKDNLNGGAGFSLVELLVVVAILAILAAIAIPLFLNQRAKAVQGAVQSDARNLATNLTTVFANLPRGVSAESLNVSLNNNTAVGATLSGSGTIGVGGEVANINVSPNTIITKTGNVNPVDGAGLKITNTGVENWACVIPLPFSVAYAQTTSFQQTCGTVVSEAGNLLPMNVATGTDPLGTTGSWNYFQSSIVSSTDQAFNGTRSLAVNATTASYNCGLSEWFPVSAGDVLTATGLLRTNQSSGETGRITIQWLGSSGYSESWADIAPLNDNSWVLSTREGTAPAGVTTMRFMAVRWTGIASAVTYVDQVGLWKGEGGVWQPPGVPIIAP